MTPAELPAYLRRMSAELKARAAIDGANAMAQAYQRDVVKSMTGTSAPGLPPARRTGTLARSVRAEPAKGDGTRATSSVAPHTVYARIQELGGDIYPVRAKMLRWTDKTGTHFAKHVRLPARPYMKMTDARRQLVRNAALRQVLATVREALSE